MFRLVAQETVWPGLDIRLVMLFGVPRRLGSIRAFSARTKVDQALASRQRSDASASWSTLLLPRSFGKIQIERAPLQKLLGDDLVTQGSVAALSLGHLLPTVEASEEASRERLGRF